VTEPLCPNSKYPGERTGSVLSQPSFWVEPWIRSSLQVQSSETGEEAELYSIGQKKGTGGEGKSQEGPANSCESGSYHVSSSSVLEFLSAFSLLTSSPSIVPGSDWKVKC